VRVKELKVPGFESRYSLYVALTSQTMILCYYY